MPKKITDNQLLGQIGETAAELRFLKIGFQFDVRSRLEAGVDAIVEVMDKGVPLAKMIAVQVKASTRTHIPLRPTTALPICCAAMIWNIGVHRTCQ